MRKIIPLLIFLLIILSTVQTGSAQTIGVKKGDWAEYSVVYNGNEPEKKLTSIRIEILNVQKPDIEIKKINNYSDGTQEIITETINLENGQLRDKFIIPANLDTNDKFYDENEGNITIQGTAKYSREITGVSEFTILYAETQDFIGRWDKRSGILVSIDYYYIDYMMTPIISSTNIIENEVSNNDVLIIGGVVGLVAVIILLIFIRKK